MKTYKNDYLNNIAFPLGGIGTGSIGLSGNGVLVDPEINNRPNRQSLCGYSGFAVKAEKDGKVVDARLLCGDTTQDLSGTVYSWYGNGTNFFAGFRHFNTAEFSAEFPFAKVKLSDTVFPAEATIEAFNPFIPSNGKDSSIPAAFFTVTLKNTSSQTLTYTVLQNMTNLLTVPRGLNIYGEKDNLKFINLNSADTDPSSLQYANITISTDEEHTSHTDYWFRGKWFDQPTMFKNELNTFGDLKNRIYDTAADASSRDTATLAATSEIKSGESKTFRFLITWYVPNGCCYWHNNGEYKYKNYYSTVFENSLDVTEYCFENWERLYKESKMFSESLYMSSLPENVLDAIGGNLSILKSSTCLRLEDGSFWAWEGVGRNTGSCEGTCQHVYNYAYALAFLFPELEKGIRENEINCSLRSDGKMEFRMYVNLLRGFNFRACVDGQMGFVIKCYREWKLSGDNEWLKKHWNDIKSCLSYVWSKENPDRWDIEKSGLIKGRQHHTLDVELFGVYAWLTGMYHAALKAAAEMADFCGEAETAEEYRELFAKGKKLLDETTFNGEYFVQLIDVDDDKPIRAFTENSEYKNLQDSGNSDFEYYWSDEAGQSKYQIENGCEIDQVLAAWHSDLNGLGEIFNEKHRKSALKAIYDYNFCEMHNLLNPCRVFACNDESGVVMCTWPNDVRKPKIPIPYSEECMTGFEYAVAANMLQCGMENEALEIVDAIRMRYDGKRRNPFSELECGASYGRAMASYSFLLIYSGFKFDLPNKKLGFKPIKSGKYFWSADGVWGNVECNSTEWKFTINYGSVELRHFITDLKEVKSVTINGVPIEFLFENGEISADMKLSANDVMVIA